jgi:hypothetical protein
MSINMTKVCSKCKQTKLTTEFSKCKDSLQSKCKQCTNEYHLLNKDKINKYHQNHYQNNTDTHKQRAAKWKKEKSEYWKTYMKQYHVINKKENPHIYKWRDLLWDSIKRLGGNKESTTHELLKYSAFELKEHLEKQNINWKTDHIDHKIPITWFIGTTPAHIANDLRNLQPLNNTENKSKRNNYSHPIDKEYYDLVVEYIKEEFKNKLVLI